MIIIPLEEELKEFIPAVKQSQLTAPVTCVMFKIDMDQKLSKMHPRSKRCYEGRLTALIAIAPHTPGNDSYEAASY